MWSLGFWKQTAERALRTAAQVALSFWVVGETGVLDVDWVQLGSVTGLAALASVLMSIIGSGLNDSETPSMVRLNNDIR